MRFLISVAAAAAALVACVQAQTPEGFEPKVDTKLEVVYGSSAVTPAGQQFTTTATASAPRIGLSGTMLSASDKYLLMMIDLDVQLSGANSPRTALLHALLSDYKTTQETVAGNATLLTTTATGPASYFGPGPPASDSAHRYTFLLFKQPTTFNLPQNEYANFQKRLSFDLPGFMTKNKLETPIAANYIRVKG